MTLPSISRVFLALFLTVTLPVFRAFADNHSLENFLVTLKAIDPARTDNPAKFKQMRILATEFLECLKKHKGIENDAETIFCSAMLETKINKLMQETNKIAEADFLDKAKNRVLQNLATTYADIAYRYRSQGEPKFTYLCDDLARLVAKDPPCANKDKINTNKWINGHISALEKQTIPSLNQLEAEYKQLLDKHLSGETYIGQCLNNQKALRELASKDNNKLTEQKLKDLRPELAQVIRSQSLNSLEIANHPLSLFIRDDATREELVKRVDPFSSEFKERVALAKLDIRNQTAELMGYGEQLNSMPDNIQKRAKAEEVNKLDFFIKNYPVGVGQTLARYPSMIGKICDTLAKNKIDTAEGYGFGDRILGTRVLNNGLVDGMVNQSLNVSLDSSPAAEKNQEQIDYEKKVSDFLLENKYACEDVTRFYTSQKFFKTKRDVMLKDNEFETEVKKLGSLMPRSGVNNWGQEMENGLKINWACGEDNDAYNAFKYDMYDRAITTIKEVEKDQKLLDALNKYAQKKNQEALKKGINDNSTAVQLSCLMPLLSRSPASSSDPKVPTVGKLITQIKSDLEQNKFEINDWVGVEDCACIMQLPKSSR